MTADAAEGPVSGQSRQYTTAAARELPTIRERRPSGLRRFWGSASSGGSQRAPSVASVASSAAESAPEQPWPRARKVASPGSSASSDLDSAQALTYRRPKVRARARVFPMSCLRVIVLPGARKIPSPSSSASRMQVCAKVLRSVEFFASSRSCVLKCVQCAFTSVISMPKR